MKKPESPFTIVPKDKKVLKSSIVRNYYKLVNAVLEPKKQQIMEDADKAATDAIIHGTGWLEVGHD